jgi:predicted ATPase
MQSLAIIVAIAEYQQSIVYRRLPGTLTDAGLISRLLLTHGFNRDDILVLTDGDAKRTDVIAALSKWTLDRLQTDGRLLFFFSGHGKLVSDRFAMESVLITYNTDPSIETGSGLTFRDIVRCLRRLPLREAYLFIDACFQTLVDALKSSADLADSDLFRCAETNGSCFFWMMANEQKVTAEGPNAYGGYFTRTLVEQMSVLDKNPHTSIGMLSSSVEKHFGARSLGKPRILLAGSADSWPFRNVESTAHSSRVRQQTPLHVARDKVTKKLLAHMDAHFPSHVGLSGAGGIGKSTLLRDLPELGRTVIVVPVSSLLKAEQLRDELVKSVEVNSPELSAHDDRWLELPDYLRVLRRRDPSITVAFDFAIPPNVSVMKFLVVGLAAAGLQFLLVARSLSPHVDIPTFECPPLSWQIDFEQRLYLLVHGLHLSTINSQRKVSQVMLTQGAQMAER